MYSILSEAVFAAAETITNVLDFKRDSGLWHGVLTVSGCLL